MKFGNTGHAYTNHQKTKAKSPQVTSPKNIAYYPSSLQTGASPHNNDNVATNKSIDLQPSNTAQILHLTLPHLDKVTLILLSCHLGDLKHMSLCQRTCIDAQFKIGLRALIKPMETDVYTLAASQQLSLTSLFLTPMESVNIARLSNLIGHPSLKATDSTYKIPNNIPRITIQRIFQMYLFHGKQLLTANIQKTVEQSN